MIWLGWGRLREEGGMKNEVVCASHAGSCNRSDPQREKQSVHFVVMPGMSGGGEGHKLGCDHEPGEGRGREGGNFYNPYSFPAASLHSNLLFFFIREERFLSLSF